MRARVLISVVFLVLFLMTLRASGAGQQSSTTPAPPSVPAPLTMLPESVLNAELKAARGQRFKLSDYSGKILVVSLWATWCGPCRFETPELVKLYRKHRADGVEVVELSSENPKGSTRAVRAWIRDFGVRYRVGWATQQVATTLMNGRDAIPQTYVISSTGRIVRRFVGINPVTTPPQWEEAIQEALNEKTTLPEQH